MANCAVLSRMRSNGYQVLTVQEEMVTIKALKSHEEDKRRSQEYARRKQDSVVLEHRLAPR
ncbi:hypothetical protein HBH70_137500 [Parastagonospora nodorum]|nr:hypothetical protein HBH49_038450 [Parastagonospora nodorum]KAH4259301.1 hypothetical protein HBI03_137300 [Parastagonospora nodorum]KAH4281880.1 hypothetical protein HBI04_044570 [Parastagonospora nodorum]KAH5134801.1 hypothetical protein HBH70_137500 [Parastagonospora nodorum]KAH5281692.1 hypothetical protein HBI71_000610 [Parastagonospora nodorum]